VGMVSFCVRRVALVYWFSMVTVTIRMVHWFHVAITIVRPVRLWFWLCRC